MLPVAATVLGLLLAPLCASE
eukprot:COSAG01_NODE_72714_length_252_cov_0.679739_1_plen_20_part_10